MEGAGKEHRDAKGMREGRVGRRGPTSPLSWTRLVRLQLVVQLVHGPNARCEERA